MLEAGVILTRIPQLNRKCRSEVQSWSSESWFKTFKPFKPFKTFLNDLNFLNELNSTF
jgi:hypothetical protein